MAKILIENMDELKWSVIPFERRFDSKGALSVDKRVSDMYVKNDYDSVPKSRAEADARGIKHFNGLMSSIPRMSIYSDNGKNVVVVDIAPTRYLIGQAMRDVVKDSNYSADVIELMSPDMANVSLISPVKIDGEYYLVSQIKGKALGSGQLHTGLVAGNIDAKYLNMINPFVSTLQNECSEELGLDLSYLNSSSFVFLVDERETGQVNFASVTRNADINLILGAYESMTKRKLSVNESLEVMALSTLPIAGVALTPLESGFKGVSCYKPTKDGLVKIVEDRGVRPYTSATVDYLSKPSNVNFLLEKAGF